MSLCGKTAFITGAGSGIGRSACQILARDGANIIAADINAASAQETIKLIKKSELKNLSIAIDVSNASTVKSALQKILETYKQPPSIIVNSAGIARFSLLLEQSEEIFQNTLDVNLKGTLNVTQVFAKAIIDHQVLKASIINLGSILGKMKLEGFAIYGASKAGVELLTKTAAAEFAKEGIRVNAVLPGLVSTAMTAPFPNQIKVDFLKQVALGRVATPEEIAEVIAFLASDKSSYVNGASINVHGGL